MKKNPYSRFCNITVLTMAMLATACGTTQTAQQNGNNLQLPENRLAAPQVRVDTDNREVAKLWAAAEKARQENRASIALELLYEAIEISPENSLLWSRAAELQIQSVEPALAESYAERSISLAGNNQALLYRNWVIIEHARNMRGDLLGARGASKQVQMLQVR